MSLTYYKFLFINTLKRKSVWITWLLYLITVIAFIIILPIASTLSVYQLWSNTTIAICQSFLGLTAAIYTSILSVNVFKDVNEDGTELIVISKPISRIRVVSSKFLLFFTFCILVNLTAVAVTAFAFFIPNIEKKFYWGLVVSMFIGNLVTFGIYGSIAILLSVRFAKAGIIVCNVIISIVLFVYQILCVFVFSNSILTLTGLEDGAIVNQSYILPVRNTDGSYTEQQFVSFKSSPNKDGEYDMKVIDWQGVKEYWDKQNAKEKPWAIIATDIGTQFSLTYSCVNVNGYSDRQAKRMYNFSRYYDYELSMPASPEFYENNSPLKFLYTGETSAGKVGDYTIYVPSSYMFPGVRSTKASYLKGTVTDIIPIADLKGKDTLDHFDVTFEQADWVKYGPLFDIMYDNIFNYDVGENKDYYSYDLSEKSKAFTLNNVWCDGTDNIKKYYELVWACFMGKHGDSKYFGSTDPLAGKTKDDFGINSVYDLNCRFLQFKDYCYYKAYEEQHKMMLEGSDNQIERYAYGLIKSQIEEAIEPYGLTCSGDGIGEYGYTIRAPKDGGSEILEPGTQTLNLTIMHNMIDQLKTYFQQYRIQPTSQIWIACAVNSSYAKYIRTSSIANTCSYLNESYLFDSLENPDRNNTWTCEQYLTRESWIPYAVNLALKEQGIYYPYGQNLQMSFYECKNRVQFWYFAAIWGGISLMSYAAGFIVYNKYDIK